MSSPTRRRSWGHRALLGLNCLVVVACFAVAAGLLVSRHYGNSIARVDLGDYTPPTPSSAGDGTPNESSDRRLGATPG